MMKDDKGSPSMNDGLFSRRAGNDELERTWKQHSQQLLQRIIMSLSADLTLLVPLA